MTRHIPNSKAWKSIRRWEDVNARTSSVDTHGWAMNQATPRRAWRPPTAFRQLWSDIRWRWAYASVYPPAKRWVARIELILGLIIGTGTALVFALAVVWMLWLAANGLATLL